MATHIRFALASQATLLATRTTLAPSLAGDELGSQRRTRTSSSPGERESCPSPLPQLFHHAPRPSLRSLRVHLAALIRISSTWIYPPSAFCRRLSCIHLIPVAQPKLPSASTTTSQGAPAGWLYYSVLPPAVARVRSQTVASDHRHRQASEAAIDSEDALRICVRSLGRLLLLMAPPSPTIWLLIARTSPTHNSDHLSDPVHSPPSHPQPPICPPPDCPQILPSVL